MRSQVQDQWEGETDFERGFVVGKEDLNGVTRLRAERKESLGEWNFGSLAIAMAEIVKT
jgi:hypothetical protein